MSLLPDNVGDTCSDQGIRDSHDPANFINKWLASQARDLDLILGNEIGIPGTNGGLVREEDLRRSDLFRMPWVRQPSAPT